MLLGGGGGYSDSSGGYGGGGGGGGVHGGGGRGGGGGGGFLGAGLGRISWDLSRLPLFEKNFYVEHPAVRSRSEASAEIWRKEKGITIIGNGVPKPVFTFEEASMPEYVLSEVLKQGFYAPSPIQSQVDFSIYLSIYLSICLPIYLPILLSISSIRLSVLILNLKNPLLSPLFCTRAGRWHY